MTVATYTRPNYTTQSGTVYPANIDALAKVFERNALAFAPHEQTAGSPAPDLTVVVDAGQVIDLSGAAPDLNEMAQQTVSGFTIPATGQTRIDRVVINDVSGVAERVAGTAVTTGGSPSAAPPDILAKRLPICQVTITSADTAITNDMITDERCGIPVKTKRASRGATIARSSNTILDAGDYDKTILATGTFTQTFTAAATLGDGWMCWYRNDGVGVITLDPNASETIDGAATKALAAAQSCMIMCDGSNFKTIGLGSATVAATQAEMEAGADNTVMATPSNLKSHPGVAKAVMKATMSAGVPTLQTPPAFNITSIADTAIGRLTVTIATDFSSAAWCCIPGIENAGGGGASQMVEIGTATQAAGSVILECYSDASGTPSFADPGAWHMIGMGDQ